MEKRYTPYPDYRNSEVEVLGNIPKHWNIKAVRYLLRDGAEGIKIGPFGSALKLEDMVESGVRVYGQENVINRDFSLGRRAISFQKYMEMQAYAASPGDLLVTMMGTSGKCELVPENIEVGIIDSHLLRLRVKDHEIRPKYFRLLLDECHEVKSQVEVSGKGSIMHGLNSSIVKGIELPIPPIYEQTQITNFLHHETAKIDTLIDKQQQLIALLKEKRQAVISHAVTRGLNPDAPMKDSGVEWLGKVPAHWVCCCLKHHAQVIDCKHITAEFFDEGVPVASISEVKGWFVDLASAKHTNEQFYLELIDGGRKPDAGDIIYSRNATVGEAAIVRDNMPPFAMGQDVCLIRLSNVVVPEFLLYVVNSGIISQQLDLAMVGSTFKRINVDNIRNFLITVPPREEQLEIVSSLQCNMDKHNCLILKAEGAIKLMQERRTALISAAVTGKIDVRNWQPPLATQADKDTP